MNYNELIERAVAWARKRGFKKIKAKIAHYDDPTSYRRPGEEQAFIPDVTGLKVGNKSYIELATKSDNTKRKVSKWKLLSTLAMQKGGKLYLLTPRGHKSFVERLVKSHYLNAEVIYLRNT